MEETLSLVNDLINEMDERLNKSRERKRMKKEKIDVLSRFNSIDCIQRSIFDCMSSFISIGWYPDDAHLSKVITLSKDEFFYLTKEDKELIIEKMNSILDHLKPDDEAFAFMFGNDRGKEINRLRYLTSGQKVTLISNDTEKKAWKEILSLYKLFFKRYIFGEKKENLSSLHEHVLNFLLIEGIYFEAIRYLRNYVKDQTLVPLFFDWYQKNKLTFIHQPKHLEFDMLKDLCVLLSDEQKKEFSSLFEKQFLKKIRSFEKKINQIKGFDDKVYKALISLKEKLNFIKELSN